MRVFGKADWRDKGGKAQLYCRVREVDEEMRPTTKWRMVTKVIDVPSDAAPEVLVREALAWRDGLVRDAAVEEALASGGAAAAEDMAERISSRVSERLGVNEAELARPFEEYARDYINLRARSRSDTAAAGGSQGGNHDILRLWILPYLDGSTPMRDITPAQVADLLGGLCDAGFSAGTICKAWTLFKGVVRFAVEQHGLRPNPCYGFRNVKKVRPRVNHLQVRQADELAETLARCAQTEAVCAARLALACGICAEEMCGLQVRDCDPSTCDAIHVRQVVAKRRGAYVLCDPKNEYRDRFIPMNGEMRRVILDRLAYLRWKLAETGERLDADTYLLKLTSPGRGRETPYLRPDGLWRRWRPVSELYGLVGAKGEPVTIHDLRHTFATSFLAKGGSVSDLMHILGHSTAYMTLEVYASSDPTIRKQAMESTGRRVKGDPRVPADLSSQGRQPTGRELLGELFVLPKARIAEARLAQ